MIYSYVLQTLVTGMSTTTIMTMTVFTETSDGDVCNYNYDNDGIYRFWN